ncbi:hypothetical protein EDC04DRAFT_2869491 [Pisolithus marmoratus]|nr:hypothetical protein EDC04DRAFT_2869491 [Pisolithus marmoratus]
MATRGYLAFPPSSLPMLSYPGPTLERSSIHLPNVPSSRSDHNQSDVERLRVCQSERIVAEQSEVEWVRGGGLLRDASGRRDKTRTERVLSGIRLREDEQRRVERWERYEARWRSVFGGSREPLTFFDFPWPLCNLLTEKSIDGLTTRTIGEFLFESVGVLGSSATRRERIRCSLLRWHPDKISPLLRRVVAEDVELVQEGVLRVFRALKALQDPSARRLSQTTRE